MTQSRTEILAARIADQQAHIASLHAEIDQAADSDSPAVEQKALIAQLMGESAATEAVIASLERRLVAARASETSEAKALRREANTETAAAIAKHLEQQRTLAPKLAATVAKLAKQLEEFQAEGLQARQHVSSLIRQLPGNQRDLTHSLLSATDGQQTLGAFLADLMIKAGVFSKLAPVAGLDLGRADLPAPEVFFTRRTESLTGSVRALSERVNQTIV